MERYSEVEKFMARHCSTFCCVGSSVRSVENFHVLLMMIPSGSLRLTHTAPWAESVGQRLQRKCRCVAICDCKTPPIFSLYTLIPSTSFMEPVLLSKQPEYVMMQIKIFTADRGPHPAYTEKITQITSRF